jgi:hypothetical protein
MARQQEMPGAHRQQRVEVGQAVETETALPIRIQVRSHLWITWGRIAMQHETMARAARGEAARLPSGSNLGPPLERELDAGLVCVCAAAFAVEALWVELVDPARGIVPEDLRDTWKAQRLGRGGRIEETLKLGVDNSALPRTLRRDLDWLFPARGKVVHFEGKVESPEPHPLGTNVAPVNVAYSAEAASRAVDLLVQVLTVCRDRPKSALETWSASLRHAFDDLLALRGTAS